jgi:hypothetical protein
MISRLILGGYGELTPQKTADLRYVIRKRLLQNFAGEISEGDTPTQTGVAWGLWRVRLLRCPPIILLGSADHRLRLCVGPASAQAGQAGLFELAPAVQVCVSRPPPSPDASPVPCPSPLLSSLVRVRTDLTE